MARKKFTHIDPYCFSPLIHQSRKNFNDLLYAYENINEGLICTYNVNQCKKQLIADFPEITNIRSLKYNRSKRELMYKNSKEKYHKNDFFEISLNDLTRFDKLKKSLFDLYGWFIVRLNIQYINKYNNNDIEVFEYDGDKFYNYEDLSSLDDFYNKKYKIIKYYLIIEAKFTLECTNYYDLYHYTDIKNLKRIIKYGLIPKSYYNYPERIYFSPDIEIIEQCISNRGDNFIILRLNIYDYENEIRKKYNFFEDPKIEDSIFTYDCINSKYIQILLNNKWIDISKINKK